MVRRTIRVEETPGNTRLHLSRRKTVTHQTLVVAVGIDTAGSITYVDLPLARTGLLVIGRSGHGVSPEKRFWRRVMKTDTCWLWTGTTIRGYGSFNKHGYAHRFSWELHNGQILNGLHVLHKCDVRACVRPEHLFLGTNYDNIRDKCAKGRQFKLGPRYGVENNASKLTTVQVLEIRKRYANNDVSMAVLASDYNIGPTQVGNIINRISWTHV